MLYTRALIYTPINTDLYIMRLHLAHLLFKTEAKRHQHIEQAPILTQS